MQASEFMLKSGRSNDLLDVEVGQPTIEPNNKRCGKGLDSYTFSANVNGESNDNRRLQPQGPGRAERSTAQKSIGLARGTIAPSGTVGLGGDTKRHLRR